MLAAIILAPLAGAIVLGLFGKRLGERLIGLVACSTVAISAISSFYAFFSNLTGASTGDSRFTSICSPGSRSVHFVRTPRWFSIRSQASTSCSSPLVGLLIHVFATGYMRGDTGYWRFFAYLNLFMFAMLVLILADNFLLMFVGWEGVGLCSYLLIGHYFTKDFANDAAKKAFIVNRVGDVGFALGVMLIFWKCGSIFFFSDSNAGYQRGVRLGRETGS